jgi:hypothetical protein
MRLRSVVTAAGTSASLAAALLCVAPTAAQASVIKRISCDNNSLHYTDSDLTLSNDYGQLLRASWDTHANFHPDKITWAAYASTSEGLDWVVLGSVGGTSSTLDDVAPSGSTTEISSLIPRALEWRMTVFDKSMGNCQAFFSF